MDKNQYEKYKDLLKKIFSLFSKQPMDNDSLLELLHESELDGDALMMIKGAMRAPKIKVKDIMVPRVQMKVIKKSASQEDILATVIESGHSRFPVIGEDIDEIVGILLAKDLLNTFVKDNSKFDIKDIMRRVIYIPESKRLNVLLREFRTSRNHMAIVIDEYSGVAGLVTIEDVIEEIIGDIEDEHDLLDNDNEDIRSHGNNRYTVQALTVIDKINDFFKINLDNSEHDTIGGLVLKAFGHVPRRGESIEFEGFDVKILRANKRHIQLMRFRCLKNSP